MRIVLVGKSQHQKTWASRYLAENHNFYEKKMGDGVRKIIRTIYPYEQFKRIRWEPLLRMYDALYKVDSNIWIQYFSKRLDPKFPDTNIVVSDVRYLNELDQLKRWGFVIVRLTTSDISKNHLFHNMIDIGPMNLITSEWYDKSFIDSVGVSYSIHVDPPFPRKKSKELDKLIQNLTNNS